MKHSTRLSYTLIILDAPRGFEPRFPESKSGVLPDRRWGKNWRRWRESNPLRAVLETAALPLSYTDILEVNVRIELTTFVPGICNPAPYHPDHWPILLSVRRPGNWTLLTGYSQPRSAVTLSVKDHHHPIENRIFCFQSIIAYARTNSKFSKNGGDWCNRFALISTYSNYNLTETRSQALFFQ